MSFKAMETKGRAMTKKLKIRFVKFERALAMQVLEQEGYFDSMKHIRVRAYPAVDETCVFCEGEKRNTIILLKLYASTATTSATNTSTM